MKYKILILIILFITNLEISNAQSFEVFINDLPNLPKQTNYRDFDYDTYQNSQTFSFSDTICADWDGTAISFNNQAIVQNKAFYGHFVDCIGKYENLDPSVSTILVKTKGYPFMMMLLNVVENNNEYKPVSYLVVGNSSDGLNTSFSFVGNTIKVYNIFEEIAIGATYNLNNQGNFILDSSTEFDENNYQGIFTY